MLRRGACDGHDQPRVVDELSVVGQQSAREPVTPNRRNQLRGAAGVDPP